MKEGRLQNEQKRGRMSLVKKEPALQPILHEEFKHNSHRWSYLKQFRNNINSRRPPPPKI